MSDWIPVPEFENVLIIMAELADTEEKILAAPVLPLLNELKNWNEGTLYLFHNPPEAGEILEDVDADMAARFALAAQMADEPAEACRDALRRMFSRAVVQKVVIMGSDSGKGKLAEIGQLFLDLDHADMVWAGDWPGQYALGMKQYHGEIFSDLHAANQDLRKVVRDLAGAGDLVLLERDGFW